MAGIVLPTEESVIATTPKDYIMLFYGPAGVGKTSFVHDLADKVLFVSTDRGTRFISALRQEVHSWNDMLLVMQALEQPNAATYDMICIDHMDDLCSMAEEAICRKMGIASLADAEWGKGWKMYRNSLQSMVQRMIRKKMGVTFICHEEVKTVKTRSVELQRTMPMLPKSAWKVIIPMADIVGYCGFRTLRKQDKSLVEIRTIETTPREDLYVKDRTGRIVPAAGYMNLDGKTFVSSFVSSPNAVNNTAGVSHGEGTPSDNGSTRTTRRTTSTPAGRPTGTRTTGGATRPGAGPTTRSPAGPTGRRAR